MEQIIYTMPLDEFTTLIKKCVRDEVKQLRLEKADELLKTEEVAKLLQISKVTLHKWKRLGVLPYHRLGSRLYFKKSEVLGVLSVKRKPFK